MNSGSALFVIMCSGRFVSPSTLLCNLPITNNTFFQKIVYPQSLEYSVACQIQSCIDLISSSCITDLDVVSVEASSLNIPNISLFRTD